MIDILMATYNGEKYVGAQIESILSQTHPAWQLIIWDDCSTDGTMDVLQQCAARYPDKIIVRQNEKNSGSASKNFLKMLQTSTAPYAMTCDQDDIWMANKIEVTLQKMRSLEAANPAVPLLVHTDLRVVNQDLEQISPSLFKLQHMFSERNALQQLLVQNIVTGCTMMVNRSLLEYLAVLPKYVIMYDWWCALLAASMGKIGFVSEATVLYRQHGKNAVGAKNVHAPGYILNKLKNLQQSRASLANTYEQAANFSQIYSYLLDSQAKALLEVYSRIPQMSKLQRLSATVRYGFWKGGIARKIEHILII